MKTAHQTNNHTPVLLEEVLIYLDPQKGDTYLDLTAGYGGHAKEILARTLQTKNSVLVDRDDNAIAELTRQFARDGAQILHADFLTASEQLKVEGMQFDIILADLGISSPHVDNPERGFSFKDDGPLDMRMDSGQLTTAAILVNESSEAELAQIIRDYGEERQAKRIARMIVEQRPFTRTTELADAIAKSIGGEWKKVHPATKTFQALRIAVNNELEQLEQALPIWFSLLKPGGRIGVISFHSLEDRIVKQAFKERAGDRYDATLQLLTKKPVSGTQTEIVLNPRSRSAKLRVAAKIKRKGNTNANSGKK